MTSANYVFTYDETRLDQLRDEAKDYLFDRGHRITKPMIDDLALLIYNLQDRAVRESTQTTTTTAWHDTASPNTNHCTEAIR
jgi:hypothetical protein